MSELRFVIHGQLTGNNEFRTPVNGVMKKTKNARADAARVKEVAIVAATSAGWEIPQAASVTIIAFNCRKDVGNIEKVPMDAIKGVVVRDDADFMEQHIFRRWDREGERYEIIVRPCEDRRPGRIGSKTGGAKRSPFSEYEQGQVLTIEQRDDVLRKVGIR